VTQPCFPGVFGPRVSRPHKAQRSTARAAYARQRAQDEAKRQAGKETREGQVLRCLAAFWNRFQHSPTARELLAWMQRQGEPVDDVNSCRPRLTYLCERGLVEAAAKRKCAVSGVLVHTWRVVSR
jgi:sulfur relay (sulfurtransferase) DsrC/TusE family protein